MAEFPVEGAPIMSQKSSGTRALIACTRVLSAAVVVAFGFGSALAQQIIGTPGSPSATTTIDGKYLPPPPAPFGLI
jgi:nitrate reductase NapE component